MVVMAMCMGDRGHTKECALLAMIYYRPAAGAMVWNVSRHPAGISKTPRFFHFTPHIEFSMGTAAIN